MTLFGDLSIIETIFYVLASLFIFFRMFNNLVKHSIADDDLAVRVRIVKDDD